MIWVASAQGGGQPITSGLHKAVIAAGLPMCGLQLQQAHRLTFLGTHATGGLQRSTMYANSAIGSSPIVIELVDCKVGHVFCLHVVWLRKCCKCTCTTACIICICFVSTVLQLIGPSSAMMLHSMEFILDRQDSLFLAVACILWIVTCRLCRSPTCQAAHSTDASQQLQAINGPTHEQ